MAMVENEGFSRQDLPRFQGDSFPVGQVSNVGREKTEGKLPPLMDDLRRNCLVVSPESNGVVVYAKTVASPYTGEHGTHFLVIPDRVDQENIPGVKDLTSSSLSSTLTFAASLAEQTFAQPGIDEVDFGWHHSRAELKGIPKQRIATFPQNLHIHITGYNAQDMKHVPTDEVAKDSDTVGKTGEALHALGESLFFHTVIPHLQSTYSDFNTLFEESKDIRGRKKSTTTGRERSIYQSSISTYYSGNRYTGKKSL